MHQMDKKTGSRGNDRVISSTDELRAFCRKLDLGEHPDFLQVMTALSAATEYMSPLAQTATTPACKIFAMSQNKCRFCD